MPRRPVSSYHPILYELSVWSRRAVQYALWHMDGNRYARTKSVERLPVRVKKHTSVLIRKLGDTDERLQQNKVTNLRIAAPRISGVLIRPGETFSFYRLIGLPTRRKGYVDGVLLSNGEALVGTAGGICQIANMIHWLVIHSPLTITKRYHHTFDPFPDDGRITPFGSGATVFYNYIDYQFCNDTQDTYQINLWFSEKCLEGELCVSEELPYSYHVYERNHRFLRKGSVYYRQNEIWRDRVDKVSGKIVNTELVTKNFAEVKYTPPNDVAVEEMG